MIGFVDFINDLFSCLNINYVLDFCTNYLANKVLYMISVTNDFIRIFKV